MKWLMGQKGARQDFCLLLWQVWKRMWWAQKLSHVRISSLLWTSFIANSWSAMWPKLSLASKVFAHVDSTADIMNIILTLDRRISTCNSNLPSTHSLSRQELEIMLVWSFAKHLNIVTSESEVWSPCNLFPKNVPLTAYVSHIEKAVCMKHAPKISRIVFHLKQNRALQRVPLVETVM